VALANGEVRVVIGHYGGQNSPIRDHHTEVHYLDVSLGPGAEFCHHLEGEAAFAYVFEGDAAVVDAALATHTLAVLGPGDELAITAGLRGARFILVAGRPLGEPIVQYGPFVMSSREEVEQALDDYRRGRLVQKKASFVGR
jgi:redox-sensitive bicupin YhaK (pirin superfamily)